MHRKFAIRAAKELLYPKIVIEKLNSAKTIAEMDNIMQDAIKYIK